MEIIIKADYEEACGEVVTIIRRAWEKNPALVLGLSTGESPLGVYSRLIALYQEGRMNFSEVKAFSLDEYLGLGESHPESYAHYMDTHLNNHINIKGENIFRLNGRPADIEEHCLAYEKAIQSAGGIDLQLLGIGENGHIGFNEPTSSLASRTRVKTLTPETVEANARFFENPDEVPRFCLTMGIGTILEAKTIVLLASGEGKARALKQAVEGPVMAKVPASALQLHPRVKIVCDEEAASLLADKDYYRWVYANKHRVNDFLDRNGSE